jgi:hypothetical protein
MPLPTISNTGLLIQFLQQWQKQINKLGLNIITPQIPWNFKVESKQGGNQLSWNKVPVGDGYEVLMSNTGDFSTGANIITIPNVSFTSYFDPVSTSGGATPAIRYYQVRATNGTPAQPHVVKGNPTQALSSTAIAPNDTATASTSSIDTSTNDDSQANTRFGSYSGDFGNIA